METYFTDVQIYTDSLFYLGIPYNPPTLSLSRAIPLKSRSRGGREEEISGAWRRVRKPHQVCKSNRLRCWYVVNPHLPLLFASLVFFSPFIFLTLSLSFGLDRRSRYLFYYAI